MGRGQYWQSHARLRSQSLGHVPHNLCTSVLLNVSPVRIRLSYRLLPGYAFFSGKMGASSSSLALCKEAKQHRPTSQSTLSSRQRRRLESAAYLKLLLVCPLPLARLALHVDLLLEARTEAVIELLVRRCRRWFVVGARTFSSAFSFAPDFSSNTNPPLRGAQRDHSPFMIK